MLLAVRFIFVKIPFELDHGPVFLQLGRTMIKKSAEALSNSMDWASHPIAAHVQDMGLYFGGDYLRFPKVSAPKISLTYVFDILNLPNFNGECQNI